MAPAVTARITTMAMAPMIFGLRSVKDLEPRRRTLSPEKLSLRQKGSLTNAISPPSRMPRSR